MKARNVTVAVMVAVMVTVLAAGPALAQASMVLLHENEISVQKMKSIFDAAAKDTSLDKDGDLKITQEGIKTFVKIDTKKKMITFFSVWGMKANVPDFKKYEFTNNLNNKLVLVRFTVTKKSNLWCDYQFLYKGGITPHTIISNYDLFYKVVRGAATSHDPDDII